MRKSSPFHKIAPQVFVLAGYVDCALFSSYSIFSPQAVTLSLKKTGELRLFWDKSWKKWLMKDILKVRSNPYLNQFSGWLKETMEETQISKISECAEFQFIS